MLTDDQRAFWSAVVAIIPVLALALTLEARRWSTDIPPLMTAGRATRVAVSIFAGVLIIAAFGAVWVEAVGLVILFEPPKDLARGWGIFALIDIGVLMGVVMTMPVVIAVMQGFSPVLSHEDLQHEASQDREPDE